jgi:type II secretory pathway pseudopilin PulG
MVVMLIMLLLLAVLAPTVQKIHRTIMRVKALTTVRLIEGGCRMYYEDFGQYPVSNDATNYVGWDGKELLVLFMTGYKPDLSGDGTPGASSMAADDGKNGFGFRTENRGKVYGPYNGTQDIETKLSDNDRPVFVDAFDEEIYYYRFDSVLDTYYTADNPTPPGLGSGSAYDDYLDNAQTMRRDFILMTAGPDGIFEAYDDVLDTDDITNFIEEQH